MRSLGKIIPVSILVVLIICLFLDGGIKKAVLKQSLNEELVEKLIVGSYVELPENTYIICTSENIRNVKVVRKDVFSSIFGTSSSVQFEVELSVFDLNICTEGRLKLYYSSNSPYKWVVDNCWLNEDIDIHD